MSLTALLSADRLPDQVVPAPSESRRFGIDIGRIDVGIKCPCSVEDLLELVDRSAPPIVVVRFPAEHVKWPARLAMGRRVAFHADSLIYWSCNLENGPGDEQTSYQVAGTEHRSLVEQLVHEVFAGYSNHYRANPLFRESDITAGYAEWAVSFLEGGDPSIVLSPASGEPMGFAALELGADRSEICLAGIRPGARGRGAYDQLLACVEHHVATTGSDDVVISTQAGNVQPQRAWARRGYLPVHAFETMHLVDPGLLRRQGS